MLDRCSSSSSSSVWSSSWLLVVAIAIATAFTASGVASANHTIIDTLPGFPGKLPFKLETGYIGVGELDEIQLFYYFIESERSPSKDPLVFWLTGGPACSGFSAIAFEIGPIGFDYDNFDGVVPQLLINKYSWTRVANIIFIDQPVGAGFSYSTTLEGRNSSDTKAAFDAYTFLRKWLVSHPEFLGNELYVGGDSYSGKIVPLVVTHILQGMETQVKPRMQLQGYLLGNPVSDNFIDVNARIPYVHRVNLISDEYYEDAKTYCGGNYVDVDVNNTLCNTTLTTIMECLLQINMCQILEPQCAFAKPKTLLAEWPDIQEAEIMEVEHLLSLPHHTPLPPLYCRGYTYVLGYKWMNDDTVREALGVRPGTVGAWYRCPKSNPFYTQELDTIIDVQKNLSTTGLRALIYSGDHDISVPWIGTLSWIESLGLDVFDSWRPWYVDAQVAGYQVKFMNSHYRLTYVTVKGAGHTAPEYKHKETMEMVDRFFARYPI